MVKKVKTIKNTVSIFRSDLEKIISIYKSAEDRGESISWIDLKFNTEMSNSDTSNHSLLNDTTYVIRTEVDAPEYKLFHRYSYTDGADYDYELHDENLTEIRKEFNKKQ